MGVRLFSHITSNRTKGNGLKLLQKRFSRAIKKKFLHQRVVKHKKRLPREVVESLSLQVFTRHIDVAFRDWFSGQLGSVGLTICYD